MEKYVFSFFFMVPIPDSKEYLLIRIPYSKDCFFSNIVKTVVFRHLYFFSRLDPDLRREHEKKISTTIIFLALKG